MTTLLRGATGGRAESVIERTLTTLSAGIGIEAEKRGAQPLSALRAEAQYSTLRAEP